MTDVNRNEKQFFDALKDIFVGADVEGDSGYVNLMRIKSRYYEKGVFPHLQQDIDSALTPFPNFREEMFDKLYSFFQRYFSESGSIYFRYTSLNQNVYEKVYTDERDVILFWKTHMLYYVKTDRIFTSMNIEVDGVKFFFDASKMELKKSNEKREVIHAFRKVDEETNTLVFDVAYSEKGRKTAVDEILKAIRKAGTTLGDEILDKAFRVFEKQSEVDFFINKDARAFLQEQFDLWMYQYLFAGKNTWEAERLAELQALKSIAYKVIDFISQFEDELVKIWNKPKFVRGSHYVITLDKLVGSAVLEKVLNHSHFNQQEDEWRELGMTGEDFSKDWITEKDKKGGLAHPEFQYLPIDTKYFPDLELDILALFEDLDTALDGWLVHSENFQAINTLLSKYKEKVKTIYFDPPYNTAASEIIYQNQYKHSSWISLLFDRIDISYDLLSQDGFFCAAIDDAESSNLRYLLDDKFGTENYQATVAIRSNPHGRAMASGISKNHEYAVFYSKTNYADIGRLPRNEIKLERYPEKDQFGNFAWINFRKTGLGSNRTDRPRLFYPIYVSDKGNVRIPSFEWSDITKEWKTKDSPAKNENQVLPIDENRNERVWNMSWERAQLESAKNLFGKKINGSIQIYRKYRPNEEGALPSTWWDDPKYSATESGTRIIKNLFGERENFSFPKSVFLMEDCIRVTECIEKSIVFDYFAGSGTTAHAIMNLNKIDGKKRKYILIEMGEHFNTVILPRIKKIAFTDVWKNGIASIGRGLSQFVKYYELEQYEDILKKAHYEDMDLLDNPYEDPYHSYVFLRDLKMLGSIDLNEAQNKAHFHAERLYEDVDLAETLSQRRGKWIKRITREEVEFQDGDRMSLTDPDWETIRPLVWWQ